MSVPTVVAVRAAALALLVVLLALSLSLAQPYLADGGFDRPREGFELSRASLAVAFDLGTPRALVGDVQGLRLVELIAGREVGSEAVQWLAQDSVVRGVAAASGWGREGAAAYAWFERDPTTGRYRYWWHWGGEQRALLEAAQALELALFVGPGGPEAYVVVPGAEGSRLERYRWGASEGETVLATERSLAAPTLAQGADGARHLAYLEGDTVDTPLGRSAQWSTVYLGPDGASRRFEGAAAPPTTLVLDARSTPVLLWSAADGRVIASDLAGAGSSEPLGVGRPVGVSGERAFWSAGASLLATGLESRGAPAAAPVNVAWSPYAVERARLLRADGVTHLVWIGSLPGGGARIVHSDDAQAMRPRWDDHVAARFGWSPWALREEAAGQLAGAVLVAVLGTMALLPLLWLLSLPLARRLPERWTRLGGSLLAVAVFALLAVSLAVRAAGQGHDAVVLIGGPWGFAVATIAGVALPPLLLRRVDLEPQPAMLAAAGLGSFVCLAVVALLALQPWFQLLGM